MNHRITPLSGILAVGTACLSSACGNSSSSSDGPVQLPFDGLTRAQYLVIDPHGDATMMWAGDDGHYLWSRLVRGAGLSTPAAIEPRSSGLGAVLGDRDGNVTFSYIPGVKPQSENRALKRYAPGGVWSDLPMPNTKCGIDFEAGPGGRLMVAGQVNDASGTRQLVVCRYEPSSGWSAPEALAKADNSLSIARGAIQADGSVLATWGDDTIGGPSGYSLFVPGSGWSPAKSVDFDLFDLLSSGQGSAMAIQHAPVAGSQDTEVLTSRLFESGNWESPQTIAGDGSRNAVSSAMSKNGSVIVVWRGSDRVRAQYFSRSTGWKVIDVPGSDPAGSVGPPLVGIDANGHAVVVWGSGRAARGYNAHIFSAHYDPVTGWTPATPIDRNGAAFFGPLAVNDSGDAIVMWIEDTGKGVHWAAFVP